MANMSYCRFYNTFQDLQDCAEHIGDFLSGDEAKYRRKLYELCQEIAAESDDFPEEEEFEAEENQA